MQIANGVVEAFSDQLIYVLFANWSDSTFQIPVQPKQADATQRSAIIVNMIDRNEEHNAFVTDMFRWK